MKLIPDLSRFDNIDSYNKTPLDYTIDLCESHYTFSLLNYGFKQSKSLIITERILKIINSKYKNGFKLLSIMDKCPLTLLTINLPVIAADGFIYDYNHIVKHLQTSDMSPMLGTKIKNKLIYIFLEDRFGNVCC